MALRCRSGAAAMAAPAAGLQCPSLLPHGVSCLSRSQQPGRVARTAAAASRAPPPQQLLLRQRHLVLRRRRAMAAVAAAASSSPPPSASTASAAPGGAAAAAAAAAGFDLPLAIALAAAAFEAYLEPAGAEEGFQERLLNDTRVTYTDEAFLREHFEGLLQLTVHGADGLEAVNKLTANSDPYVVATLGDSAARTEVAWGSLAPAWGSTHPLYVRRAADDVLWLRVRDENVVAKDVDLGAVAVRVKDLLADPGKQVTLKLVSASSGGGGTVTVSAVMLPFSRADVLDAAIAEDKGVVTEPNAQAMEEIEEGLDTALQRQQADGKRGGAGDDLGSAVEQAKDGALKTLSGAVGQLQGALRDAGLDDAAAAAAKGAEAAVSEAAQQVSDAVGGGGLAAAVGSDLQALLSRVAASRGGGGDATAAAAKQQQQQLTTAAAATVVAAAAEAAAAGVKQGAVPPAGAAAAAADAVNPGAAWKALASVAGKVLENVFKPVAYVESVATDTQAWLHVSYELREVVVAFRGTEQVKVKDLLSDINLIPTALDAERTGGIDLGIGTIPLPFASFKKNKDVMVHSGFLAAYDSVKGKVARLVEQLTADATPERPWQVYVTGHSLGGALATLCAYDLAGRSTAPGAGAPRWRVAMMTYGAPRVGNRAFAERFDARLQGRAWRVTNRSDIVPSVPRLMGYAHVGLGVRLEADGRLTVETAPKDVLGEGREVAEVLGDLASQAMEVASGKRSLKEVQVDEIAEHELQILNALVDGSAVGQHMEDFYLQTLQRAVLAADPRLAGKVAAAAVVGAPAGEGAAAAAAGKQQQQQQQA